MKEKNEKMLELLRYNEGFTHPEKWIEYGIIHNFQKVQADILEKCPDCGARSFKFVGQFVYYSTLINLQSCVQCGLVFSDKRIDLSVIQAHFEQAYKDEVYFSHQRSRIFEQIAKIADNVAPQGARILDVGGAKGHLLATLKRRRSDLNFVLNDLSKEACSYAASKYAFQTILGSIHEIEGRYPRFDVIIMSDVIYYEPELRKLWDALPLLLSDNGTLIIRVPNKLPLIRFWQFISCAIRRPDMKEMQDNIKFFNPEHLYVFSQRYLLARLKMIGFRKVTTIPSGLLIQDKRDLFRAFVYFLAKVISIVSFGNIILTPSMIVIATNNVSNKINTAQPCA